MTKRLYQINAYRITTDKREYIVTLKHLRNTPNGNPRYKAVIIFIEDNTPSFYNAVYTFTGHYFGDYKEAEHIVKYHEERKEG